MVFYLLFFINLVILHLKFYLKFYLKFLYIIILNILFFEKKFLLYFILLFKIKLGENSKPIYAFEGAIESGALTINWARDKINLFKDF